MPDFINLGALRRISMQNLEKIRDISGVSQVDHLRSKMQKMGDRPRDTELTEFLDIAKDVRERLTGKPRQYLTYLIMKPVQFLLGKIGPEQREVGKAKELQQELQKVTPEHLKRFRQTLKTKELFQPSKPAPSMQMVWAVLRRIAHEMLRISE